MPRRAKTNAGPLDRLGAGIFLVDAGCRIVHANAVRHDILRANDLLHAINGELMARNSLGQPALARSLLLRVTARLFIP